MDQTKIGKLIAKLRKEKGMTQRELGDKVGVGFKAVSKWERGITCPDISIINELSKILGITSDELLTGELNEEHKTSNNPNQKKNDKKILLIIPILFIIITIFIIYKISNNHVEIYNLDSASSEYYVKGKLILKKSTIIVQINKLEFINKELNNTVIKNYKYSLESKDNTLIKIGYLLDDNELPTFTSVAEFTNSYIINYENTIDIDPNKIIQNGLILKMTFLTNEESLIQKEIPLSIKK